MLAMLLETFLLSALDPKFQTPGALGAAWPELQPAPLFGGKFLRLPGVSAAEQAPRGTWEQVHHVTVAILGQLCARREADKAICPSVETCGVT